MNIALIFAGGTGQRMNTVSVPKQFLLVHDKPIIIHTLEKFQNSNEIDAIVVVCLKEYIYEMKQLKEKYHIQKIVSIVGGGDNGQSSIFNGLCAINRFSKSLDDIVLIHDGVRPIIRDCDIKNNIKCVKEKGNCITVAQAKETILVVKDGKINDIESRKNCFLGRAPQSFYFQDIFKAHLKANQMNKHDFVDSATMMSFFGQELFTIIGPDDNIKVTTPMDYYLYKTILDVKENEQIRVIDK